MSPGKNMMVAAGAFLLITNAVYLEASPGEGETEEAEPQVSRGITLPVWEPGDMVGEFDVRIWPDDMVLWLERENLRQITRDPNIPEEERAVLKQLLARQIGWGRRWIGER